MALSTEQMTSTLEPVPVGTIEYSDVPTADTKGSRVVELSGFKFGVNLLNAVRGRIFEYRYQRYIENPTSAPHPKRSTYREEYLRRSIRHYIDQEGASPRKAEWLAHDDLAELMRPRDVFLDRVDEVIRLATADMAPQVLDDYAHSPLSAMRVMALDVPPSALQVSNGAHVLMADMADITL